VEDAHATVIEGRLIEGRLIEGRLIEGRLIEGRLRDRDSEIATLLEDGCP
jgi:hypothetical protein